MGEERTDHSILTKGMFLCIREISKFAYQYHQIPLRWFQMVARFWEKNVGTHGTSAVHATYGHMTTRVLLHKDYVIGYNKCTQTLAVVSTRYPTLCATLWYCTSKAKTKRVNKRGYFFT